MLPQKLRDAISWASQFDVAYCFIFMDRVKQNSVGGPNPNMLQENGPANGKYSTQFHIASVTVNAAF